MRVIIIIMWSDNRNVIWQGCEVSYFIARSGFYISSLNKQGLPKIRSNIMGGPLGPPKNLRILLATVNFSLPIGKMNCFLVDISSLTF